MGDDLKISFERAFRDAINISPPFLRLQIVRLLEHTFKKGISRKASQGQFRDDLKRSFERAFGDATWDAIKISAPFL